MGNENISIKNFYDKLDSILNQSSYNELKNAVKNLAKDLAPAERNSFLEKFKFKEDDLDEFQNEELEKSTLQEIRDLEEEIEELCTAEPDWESYYDEDSLGEFEQLVEPLANLFIRVNQIFDNNAQKESHICYEKLFGLFGRESKYGQSICFENLSDKIDLNETSSRYLSSIYLTTPMENRPEKICEGLLKCWLHSYYENKFDIQQVLEVCQSPLQDWNLFLEKWVAFLKNKPESKYQNWFKTAFLSLYGTAGLEKLAKEEGVTNYRYFYDWAQILFLENNFADANDACIYSLDRIPKNTIIRAAIADIWEQSAQRLFNEQSIVDAKYISFDEKPNMKKLASLYELLKPDLRGEFLQHALNIFMASIERQKKEATNSSFISEEFLRPASVGDIYILHIHLLSLNINKAFDMVKDVSLTSCSFSENKPSIFIIFFFALTVFQHINVLSKHVKYFWNEILAKLNSDDSEQKSLDIQFRNMYESLLTEQKIELNESIFSWCIKTCLKQIQAIVGQQNRHAYGHAARLTHMCREVLICIGKEKEGNSFFESVRIEYKRFPAFQKELGK